MNMWDSILEFFWPSNATLTVSWEGTDEDPYDDGKRVFTPMLVTTTFVARTSLKDPYAEELWRFHNMQISGPLLDEPGVIAAHRIDKIKNVPVRFLKCTEWKKDPEADTEQ